MNILNNNLQENRNLSNVIDESKYDLNSLCRLSLFTVKDNIGDVVLLYNVINGFFAELSTSEYDYILSTSIKDLLKSSFSSLIHNYLLVPNDFDETCVKEYFETSVWDNTSATKFYKEIKSYVIFTTTDCNARCFYCYEKGAPKIKMSHKTAEDVANFIVNEYKNFKDDKEIVHIQWFGGEPLYNTEAIETIVDVLIKNNVKFESSMISNGLLFSPSLCHTAKTKWNMNRIQITLDGTEKVYNKIKHYTEGGSSSSSPFKTVIENIKYLLAENIKVIVRLNADLHNIDDLKNLIKYLHHEIGHPNKFSVYFSFLFEYEDKFTHTEEERNKLYLKAEELMMFMYYYRYNYLSTLRDPFNLQKPTNCMLDSGQTITISPEGKISNCEHFVNKNFFGSIYKSKSEWDYEYLQKSSRSVKEKNGPCCKKCPFYVCCKILEYCEDSKICSEEQYNLQMLRIKLKMNGTWFSVKDKQMMNNKQNNEETQQLNRIANELELLNDYKSLTLWERIKILFGGNVYRDPHSREQTTYNGNKMKE